MPGEQFFELPFGGRTTTDKLWDGWAGPYASVAEANASVPAVVRRPGRTVVIVSGQDPADYWWAGGTGDANLVPKVNTTGNGGQENSIQDGVLSGGTFSQDPDSPFNYVLQPTSWQFDSNPFSLQEYPFSVSPTTAVGKLRYDVVALTDTGTLVVIPGTESTNPFSPFFDSAHQLKIGLILVGYDTSTIKNNKVFVIYRSDNFKEMTGISLDNDITELKARPIATTEYIKSKFLDGPRISYLIDTDDLTGEKVIISTMKDSDLLKFGLNEYTQVAHDDKTEIKVVVGEDFQEEDEEGNPTHFYGAGDSTQLNLNGWNLELSQSAFFISNKLRMDSVNGTRWSTSFFGTETGIDMGFTNLMIFSTGDESTNFKGAYYQDQYLSFAFHDDPINASPRFLVDAGFVDDAIKYTGITSLKKSHRVDGPSGRPADFWNGQILDINLNSYNVSTSPGLPAWVAVKSAFASDSTTGVEGQTRVTYDLIKFGRYYSLFAMKSGAAHTTDLVAGTAYYADAANPGCLTTSNASGIIVLRTLTNPLEIEVYNGTGAGTAGGGTSYVPLSITATGLALGHVDWNVFSPGYSAATGSRLYVQNSQAALSYSETSTSRVGNIYSNSTGVGLNWHYSSAMIPELLLNDLGIKLKNSGTGGTAVRLYGDAYYTPTNDFDYVQKKYVVDSIAGLSGGSSLPSTTGHAGQPLTNDGSGGYSWQKIGVDGIALNDDYDWVADHSFLDTHLYFKNAADPTKYFQLSASGFANGTNFTYQMPKANGTLVGSAAVLTAGRVPFMAANNQLSDNASFLFSANNNGSFWLGTASNDSKVNVGGNISIANPGTRGYGFSYIASLMTDNSTAASGTQSLMVAHSFANPTFAAVNTGITITSAVTLFVDSPTAGTNITFGKTYGVYNVGNMHVGGFLNLTNQASAPVTPTTSGRLFFDTSNRLSWKGTNGFVRTLDGTANTADRIYTLPDKAGTFAMLSDITGVGSTLTLASAASANPYLRLDDADNTLPSYSSLAVNASISANTTGLIISRDNTLGGLLLYGFTNATGSGAIAPIYLNAIHGTVAPTVGVRISSSKWNGTTGTTNMAAGENLLEVLNNGTVKHSFLGDGSLNTSGPVNGATPAEMGYLSGVTSSLQTQINAVNTALANKLSLDDFNQNPTGFFDFIESSSGGLSSTGTVSNATMADGGGHNGITTPTTGSSAATSSRVASGGKAFLLGYGTMVFECVFKSDFNLSDATNTYEYQLGFSDDMNVTNPANAAYVRYSNGINSGKLQGYVIVAGGTALTVDLTTVVATQTWYKIKIVITTTSCTFYVNDVAYTAINAVPNTVATGFMANIIKSAGTTARSINVDMIRYRYALTTAR